MRLIVLGLLLAATAAAADERYTPVGAERAGNAEGTIPAWNGGLNEADWPKAYRRGGRLVNPYPQDQPLFDITPRNYAGYSSRLSEAHQALLRKYPEYRMPVYATRRSASYAPQIYRATQANALTARLGGPDELEGARLGFPFPHPRSGAEAMWNHRARYRGDAVESRATDALVPAAGGAPQFVKVHLWRLFRYANLADPADPDKENVLFYHKALWSEMGSQDLKLFNLVRESVNTARQPRAIWAGGRGSKLFRLPPVGHDVVGADTDQMMFLDMGDMYNGAFDRYTWKMLGKRELYIPYNSYRLSDGSFSYQKILTPGFIRPEAARYELHRVWGVEATLRSGFAHAFGKRRFYLDEDSWNIVLVENYDPAGRLWRFQEGHLIEDYGVQFATCAPDVVYDMRQGRYFASGLLAEETPPKYDVPGLRRDQFLPASSRLQ